MLITGQCDLWTASWSRLTSLGLPLQSLRWLQKPWSLPVTTSLDHLSGRRVQHKTSPVERLLWTLLLLFPKAARHKAVEHTNTVLDVAIEQDWLTTCFTFVQLLTVIMRISWSQLWNKARRQDLLLGRICPHMSPVYLNYKTIHWESMSVAYPSIIHVICLHCAMLQSAPKGHESADNTIWASIKMFTVWPAGMACL